MWRGDALRSSCRAASRSLAIEPIHHGRLQRTEVGDRRERVVRIGKVETRAPGPVQGESPSLVISHALLEFLRREIPAAGHHQQVALELHRSFGHAPLERDSSIYLEAIVLAGTARSPE